MSYIIVFTTTSDKESAQKIADELLKKNLAACVSFTPIFSSYKWQGSIQKESEIELQIKTRAQLYEKVEETIKSLHMYETPQIIAVAIKQGCDNYLKWIDKSLKVD
ncbi:MAG: divalent-cation tolerance protein CutA [Campylobacteraceae bacterium]|jgi:periplasmic divalent cation tolerance protein|nr:divalent-cation tolerance protein CutA [Campylobacteraceae bacterium]